MFFSYFKKTSIFDVMILKPPQKIVFMKRQSSNLIEHYTPFNAFRNSQIHNSKRQGLLF